LQTTTGILIRLGSGGIDSDSNVISNNIIRPTSLQTVTYGIYLLNGISPTNLIINNNVFGGGAQFEIGVELTAGAIIHNNIISQNSFIGIRETSLTDGSVNLMNNIFHDNSGGHYKPTSGSNLNTAIDINALSYAANNLVGNPNLVNPNPGGDYHLQSDSIAIDAGLATNAPSDFPSSIPSQLPSRSPTAFPTATVTNEPSDSPSQVPSDMPSQIPSSSPTVPATNAPSDFPSDVPSQIPTFRPTAFPTAMVTNEPSDSPSKVPSDA